MERESKHTPGPWEPFFPSPGMVYEGGDKQATIRSNDGIHVATIHTGGLDRPAPIAPAVAANARLIAASPEMLEACKGICSEMDRLAESLPDADWISVNIRLNACLAAIAKATGTD